MKNKIKTFISINLLILSVLIACSNQFDVGYAQLNGDSLTIPTNLVIHEFAKATGTIESNDSINIDIESSTWNITHIELNFTDIQLGREIKVIEDGYGDEELLKAANKKEKALGVQVNITEPTIVYGVKIYGIFIGVVPANPIYFQINGYDNLTNSPNSTRYGMPVVLNMTGGLHWHTQTFSSPISLSVGQYFFVLNGTGIGTSENSKYFWIYNEDKPTYPNLYASEYTIGAWLDGVQGEPFLYQIIQQTDRSYNPESINMTAEIDGVPYNITNGIDSGTGNLTLSNLNFSPNNESFQIPIGHGLVVDLSFNISYNLHLEDHFNSESSVVIQEGSNNSWSINPEITRFSDNYSVEFSFPNSWYNLTFKRNGVNVTSDVFIYNNYVIIPNNTITEGASWLITARSSKIDFDLDVSRTEFYAGQELKFFITDPVEGNYTFVLTDTFKVIIHNTTKVLTPESNSFTYTIPSSALDGDYKAYVYWFNGTDAGVVTQVFTVILPDVIDWALIIGIVVIAGLGSAVSISSIVLIKKNKRKKLAVKQKTINKFMDILNLNYVIVIEKKSSLNVYDQAFTGKKFNSTLISGFLEAIHHFGLDITGADERSQTVKLEYQNSKILMSDFKHFRLIFIMKDLPSPQFYEVIDDLSLEIEEKYGMYLKEFKGNLQPFEGIEDLLKSHLGTAFLYPLKLTGTGKMKIAAAEKALINKAIATMKKTRLEYFYVTQLIREKSLDSKEIEALYSLIIKRIFNPFS